AEVRDRLFGVARFGGGIRRHLVAEGMDRTGATWCLAVVPGASHLRKHLGDCIGHRGLSEIGTLGDPRTGPQLSPGVDMDRGRPAATPEQAVIGRRTDLALCV